jgi:hypothetical protein
VRLWSLHPSLLDARGLVAVWREALLAQAVLRGATVGYRHHPQLERFRAASRPRAAIAAYLLAVRDEAGRRSYRFDVRRIGRARDADPIPVGYGQLEFEWRHLRAKLRVRSPDWLERLGTDPQLIAHPLFAVAAGGIETWERSR